MTTTTHAEKMNKLENIIKFMLKVLVIEVIIATIIICTTAIVCSCTHDVQAATIDTTETTQPTAEITENEADYASVYAWQVYSGDFGEDQMSFLKKQCEKYEISMELMLSIICTESGFRSDAQSSRSTAAGYCQILSGSAEWVYEDLLKYGEYDTDNHTTIMTTNWKLNIEMGCRIIYCWYWNCNESWELAVQRYHGGDAAAKTLYLNTVNSHMEELFGMTVADLK